MTSAPSPSWDDIGLWAGFLDRLPASEAVEVARDLEGLGVGTIWLQEFSGVDPFVRATLYLAATTRLTVALGVAVIAGRDPEAMVAASATIEEAFPGRFVLGLGVSHAGLLRERGHVRASPLGDMERYLAAMDQRVGRRRLPRRVLGALGPQMVALAGRATDGVHTYFSPVEHTASVRASVGSGAAVLPSQMIALERGEGGRARVRDYLGLCLGMANYTANLRRHGFGDTDLASVSDRLVDALVVPDRPEAIAERLAAQRTAGADQVVVQLVPPPPAARVLERLSAGVAGLTERMQGRASV